MYIPKDNNILYTKDEFIYIFKKIIKLAYKFIENYELTEVEDLKKELNFIYEKYIKNEKYCVEYLYDKLPIVIRELEFDSRMLDYNSIKRETENVRKEIFNFIFDDYILGCQLKTIKELEDFLIFRNKFLKNNTTKGTKMRMIEIFGKDVLKDVEYRFS